jgi:glycerate-2-kinase
VFYRTIIPECLFVTFRNTQKHLLQHVTKDLHIKLCLSTHVSYRDIEICDNINTNIFMNILFGNLNQLVYSVQEIASPFVKDTILLMGGERTLKMDPGCSYGSFKSFLAYVDLLTSILLNFFFRRRGLRIH